ncbi:methyltransferase domain-containing protein [Actinocatenispora rupis]|uniref:Methyltransferase domain-containing protein n=1 Tax=Actinocatenispora rupis TaxID=519421 RepID=A0A8J3J2G0_9ACTN|nr:class I SAM-dependent methyltransferase [Actinocatenispora rupis]GID10336.1 hypothetical protein Aru02nite_12250 [Actinocatenispora rupis]
MRTDYPELFRDDAAVSKYENVVYRPGGYSASISARQRDVLRGQIRRWFPEPPVQHDFACGTGRALLMLADLVCAGHGYDVSPAMLRGARDAGCTADLHLVPPDGPVPMPARTTGPTLVTMFRLLLNATEPVRDRALAFAAAALPHRDSGLLVLENHGRSRSLRHLGRWRHRGDPWFSELSDRTVRDLLARHGFELVGTYGFALTTPAWYKTAVLRAPAGLLDTYLAPRLPSLSTDVLYVARRLP